MQKLQIRYSTSTRGILNEARVTVNNTSWTTISKKSWFARGEQVYYLPMANFILYLEKLIFLDEKAQVVRVSIDTVQETMNRSLASRFQWFPVMSHLSALPAKLVERWRERTKMERITSRLASAIVDVVEFRPVWDRIKPIIRNKTDKCSEHNPRIGSLTDLHTR